MLNLFYKDDVFGSDIKKISTDPLCVAGRSKKVRLIDDSITLELEDCVNALASSQGSIAIGVQSGKVFVADPKDEYSLKNVFAHKSNVCSLDFIPGYILSGSWDHTTILYSFDSEMKIFQHPESVWCVSLISPEEFITGCADGIIRIFKNGAIHREIDWHNYPVRGICIDKAHIYSVDNHGKAFKMNMKGELLKMRELDNLCFCLCKHNKYIVAAGEDGNIYFMDEDLRLVSKTKMKCSSIWDCKSKDDALYVAGSNGSLYIFKEGDFDPFPIQEDEVVLGSKAEEDNQNINEMSSNVKGASNTSDNSSNCKNSSAVIQENQESKDKNDVSDQEEKKKKLNQDPSPTDIPREDSNIKYGVFTSGGLKYKVERGKVYVEMENGWNLIGDNVPKYDNSFPVTLGDKTYTLSFNNSDNVHEVATKFLRENKLGLEFHSEIVDFIRKNFKKDTLYKKYGNIDLKGVEKVIGHSRIIDILKEVGDGKSFSQTLDGSDNIYEIEDLLFNQTKDEIPKFVVYDICKYLVSKNIRVDLSSIFRAEVENKKEAKALGFLMTNLVEDPPVRLQIMDKKMRRIRDRGLLEDDDLDHFFSNLSIKKSK